MNRFRNIIAGLLTFLADSLERSARSRSGEQGHSNAPQRGSRESGLQRVGAIVVTLLAVAVGRAVMAWWSSPPSQEASSEAWSLPDYVWWTLIALVVILSLAFLKRRMLVRSQKDAIQPVGDRILQRITVPAPNGLKTLLLINVAALILAAEVELSQVGYVLVHLLVFVTALATFYATREHLHVVWVVSLGMLAIIYCPVIHLLKERDVWSIFDWVAAILLGSLWTLMSQSSKAESLVSSGVATE